MVRFFCRLDSFRYLKLDRQSGSVIIVPLKKSSNRVITRKSTPGIQVGDLDIDKLEKLIIKIAVFSLLYTFPAALHIGAQFYESWWRSEATKKVIYLSFNTFFAVRSLYFLSSLVLN